MLKGTAGEGSAAVVGAGLMLAVPLRSQSACPSLWLFVLCDGPRLFSIDRLIPSKEACVLMLEIGVSALLVAGLVFFLKRHSGPTRSVAHVLYDVEHPTRDKS